jgi:sulfatase maturation enzyme AslB (radical SAM superfamily)
MNNMVLFPKHIQIETALLCNSNCIFCPHKDMKRGPDYMEDWVWKKIIDESYGKGVIYRPFMINEPFVDLRMPEIIRYIRKDPTAKVEFNSNGNFHPKFDVAAALDAGIDWIRFSIDGYTEDTFKKSGRGGNFNKIVNNVLEFIDENNRQGSKCHVEVRMIDLDFARHEQNDFVNYWKQYAHEVTITQLYTWPWDGQIEPFRAPCPKIKSEMFFMSDGCAVLCCWDAFARGVIGDVKRQTVEEIWLGDINQQYRNLLGKGERDKIHLCSKCDAFKKYDFSKWTGY